MGSGTDQLTEQSVCESVCLDDLVEVTAHLERRHARFAFDVARLADAGEWAVDGSLSMAIWLQQHCRMSHRDATRLLIEGRFLNRYDAVRDAAFSGSLSASQVSALRNVVTKPTAVLFGQHQHGLVNAFRHLDPVTTERACQSWRAKAEAVADMPVPKLPDRSWTSSRLADGTMVGRFVLDPAAATELETALQTARTFDGAGDDRPHGVRNADAATEIIAFFNANHDGDGTPRHRPHVALYVQSDDLNNLGGGHAVTDDGHLLPTWATDAYLCDCVIHRVLRTAATITDYGRSIRSVPPQLFRAVADRDRGCRFTGCTRKIAWCDAHHVQWWRRNGETKLDNLVLLCSRHHHLIHRPGWTLQLDPNGDLHITNHLGHTSTTHPYTYPATGPPGHGPPS